MAGFGTGAESAIIAPFLSEFVPGRYRGRFIGSLAGFFSFGFVLAALLGYFIVPNVPEGWRVGGISAPIVIGLTDGSIGFGGVFVMTTAVLAAGVLSVIIFGPSTRGRTLEDITAEELGTRA